MLERLGEESAAEGVRARFYAMLDEQCQEEQRIRERRGPVATWLEGWWPRRPAWQAAVALAMLVFGLWLAPRLGLGDHSAIRELRSEMQSMTRAVTLALLEHQSPSERLRAVGLSHSSTVDTELTQALLDVIDGDPSVNVRLAALDVLAGLVRRPDVRSGLLESFPHQDSPAMQAAMADVMLQMNGPRSRAAIERLLENEELSELLREYLQRTLSRGGDET